MEIKKNWNHPAVRRRHLNWLFTRLLLLLFLLPPFVWAVTEGQWGGEIRLKDKELIGNSWFGRFSGKVDLTGISLRVERRRHHRSSSYVLVGAKKREELRIDGFVDRNGNSLLDLVRNEFKVPLVEVP